MSSYAYAQDDVAALAAEAYRIKTGAEVSVIYESDVQPGEIEVKSIQGEKLYEKIKYMIEQGEEEIYVSGLSLFINTELGAGKKKYVSSIFAGQDEIKKDVFYRVALSKSAAEEFSDYETIAHYKSDSSLLKSYSESFYKSDDASESKNASSHSDTSTALKSQSNILMSAIVLLIIALIIYYIIRKKKLKDKNIDL